MSGSFIIMHSTSSLQSCSQQNTQWQQLTLQYSHFRRDKMSKEPRELTLRKGRFDKSVIYKVEKHSSVIFKLAPEFLEDETVSIFINYPEDGSQFDRDKYQDIFKVKSSRRKIITKITISPLRAREK